MRWVSTSAKAVANSAGSLSIKARTPWKSLLVAREPSSSHSSRSAFKMLSNTRQSLPVANESACSGKSLPVIKVLAIPAMLASSRRDKAPTTGPAQPDRPMAAVMSSAVVRSFFEKICCLVPENVVENFTDVFCILAIPIELIYHEADTIRVAPNP